jgi:SAM-dependent methyltransferase
MTVAQRVNALPLETVPACGLCGSTHARRRFAIDAFTFVRCHDCGLLRLNPRVAPSSLAQLYGDGYHADGEAGDDRDAQLRNPTFAYRRAVLERHTNARVIMEIGCGDGNFLAYLQRHGWTVNGTEVTPESVRLVHKKHGLRVQLGAFEALPMADRAFPVVAMYHVVEHLYDAPAVLRAVAASLAPGGIVHIQVPHAAGVEGRLFGRYFWGLRVPQHAFMYDHRTLRLLLSAAGLRIVSTRSYDPWHSPAITANSIRAVAAALLKRKEPPLAVCVTGNGAVPAQAPSPARTWRARRVAERLLAGGALLVSRGAALVGSGNVLDVIAQKPATEGRGR